MPAQTITIPYSEAAGSPTFSMDESGFSGQRVLLCAYTNRVTLAQQLKGGTFDTARYLPQSFPGFSKALVSKVDGAPFYDEEVRPDGADTSAAVYVTAQLTVSYKTGLDQSDPGDDTKPQVQESIEPYAEFMTLPAQGFFWSGTNGAALKDEEAPGKLFKGANWNITIKAVKDIPSATYSLCGKVNADQVHSNTLNVDFDAETLLYNPPVLTRVVQADGTLAWDIAYRFSFRPQGWNRFWRGATQEWERIYNKDGPADPYETGDFTTLVG